jgi:Uma2 family endonuclease
VTLTTTNEPTLIRWTREEYYKLAETGVFDGRRVELIRGQIFEMSPQKSEHAAVVTQVDDVLRPVFAPAGCCIRVQCPLELGQDSDPEPDIAVVTGRPLDYVQAHPTTAALIVEVAETTLASDRTRKASLYAAAGIADYWIDNLIDRQLEIYRDPVPDEAQPYGFGYASVTIYTATDAVSPLAAPHATVAVADLLP